MRISQKQNLSNIFSDEFANSLESMPDCLEKNLSQLHQALKSFGVRKSKKSDPVEASDDLKNSKEPNTEKIRNLLKNVSQFLKVEGLDTYENQKLLKALKLEINALSWSGAAGVASRLLKEIRPFDIPKTIKLVEASEKYQRILGNQKVILILGGTGSGKSTTVHFLGLFRNSRGSPNHLNYRATR